VVDSIRDMKVTQVQIDAVFPHPANVRQGDVGAITLSLEAHGQYRPIIVQKSTGHIIAGNHTWRAAKVLGWQEIAVIEQDVDDDEALRILLVDNRANDLATYDEVGLVDLLKQLAESESQLDGTGYTLEDLDDKVALNELMLTLTENPISELHEYLAVVKIRLDLDKETADLFRAQPGNDDVEKLKGLLGVG